MNRATHLFISAFLVSSFLCGSALAQSESLYQQYSRASEVSVYVSTPKEVGVQGVIDPEALKRALEKGLVERKSIHFKIVQDETQATLRVEADIQGFYFTEHDPVDMLMGVGMAAMDAAKADHFARLEADFRVVDVKRSQVLWKDRLTASLTDEKMTETESKLKILDRTSEVFIKSAFGKAKKNR